MDEQLVACRPRLHRRPWQLVVLAVLQVVSAELGLQLRGAVRVLHPRHAADLPEAVDDGEGRDALAEVAQRLSEAHVPGTDDEDGVRVLRLAKVKEGVGCFLSSTWKCSRRLLFLCKSFPTFGIAQLRTIRLGTCFVCVTCPAGVFLTCPANVMLMLCCLSS